MKKDIRGNKKIVISFSIIILILLSIVLIFGITKEETVNQVYKFSQTYEYTGPNTEEIGMITNYQEYKNMLNDFDMQETPGQKIPKSAFNYYYFLYYGYSLDECYEEMKFNNIQIKNQVAIINFDVNLKCDYCTEYYTLYLVPITKKEAEEIVEVQTEFSIVEEALECYEYTVDKPILYLYPENDTNISVKLKYSNRIVTSYPKYKDGWNVLVKSNGDLYDENNNYYYALYWDEQNTAKIDFSEGFYITKDNAISFLEEKLTIIGLNAKERNEFIMYWLPKLEQNEQSLVYFELTEERQLNNELIINPTPDSLLRVNMHIKKVTQKTEIKEQDLPTFKREGFVAVEWGGTIH